jgi:hypothetical protein
MVGYSCLDAMRHISTIQYCTVLYSTVQWYSSASPPALYLPFMRFLTYIKKILIKPNRRAKDVWYFGLDGEERYTDILRILDRVPDPTSDRIYRRPLEGLERCTYYVPYIYMIYDIWNYNITVGLVSDFRRASHNTNSVLWYQNFGDMIHKYGI